MSDKILIELANEDDTVALGKRLAAVLPPSCVVSLLGTLGAGKTRLVRAFAEACGIDPRDVTSPTFTLWQTYHGDRTIHHLDAYRIADEDEFDQLGVHESFDTASVMFIEWADRIEGSLPRDRITIQLQISQDDRRVAEIETPDDKLDLQQLRS